jgi:hypothetical protein
MIYEIINPSDECTCKAESLSVAAFCAILLSPNFGVGNTENDEERFFAPLGAVAAFQEKWGDAAVFLRANECAIAACLESYFYGSASRRAEYDLALELIDDPAKRETFKAEAENRSRTSMNKIVLAAWRYAKEIKEVIAKKPAKEGQQ